MSKIREVHQDMEAMGMQFRDIVRKCTTPEEIEVIAGHLGVMLVAVTTQDEKQAGQCMETINLALRRGEGKEVVPQEVRAARLQEKYWGDKK